MDALFFLSYSYKSIKYTFITIHKDKNQNKLRHAYVIKKNVSG
jgi:hypothetical protein